MLSFVKNAIKALPGFRQLAAQRDMLQRHRDILQQQLDQNILDCDSLRAEVSERKKSQGFVPPGHFYSPVPAFDEIKRDEERIWGEVSRTVPGVEMNESGQLDLLKNFLPFYQEMPFQADATEGLRYCYVNPAYSYSDAVHLHCMMRHVQAKRIIEVGSGFSSCMMLDTNELFFDNSIETTFIEPYPELLLSLVKETDKERIKTIPSRLQEVDLTIFDALEANDILFIDSTHVSKIDSDVNHILFEVLPRLSDGVYIHFHDIFFPFEYPSAWVLEGRAWTEAYALKAFLQFNSRFQVVLMNTYMQKYHEAFYQQNMPLCLVNTGASIWLKKG